MSADLTVTNVKVPSPLLAPCPVAVIVTIENVGSDPTDPVPFDVTIDLGVGDAPDRCFCAEVGPSENLRLNPRDPIDVEVRVQFPCTSPVTLTATVDKKRQVANNTMPSAPSMMLAGLVPIPTPWLTVALRVGIVSATGTVTFDPDGFCPGKPVVAQVVIENKGCVASKATTTDVILFEGSVPRGNKTVLVPALPPGQSHLLSFSFSTPTAATGISGTLAVLVRADVNFANPDQCDRSQLLAMITKPFATGGPPRLTLTADGAGAIRPGEKPSLSWGVRNDCSEIGTADVKILFGIGTRAPTELYRTTIDVPLRDTVGEDLAPARLTVPPIVASAFWTFGTKTLTLEVTGNGPDPGPYSVTLALPVVPEFIDATWWTWGTSPVPGAVRGVFLGTWKSTYVVFAAFANRSRGAMTVTTLSALEHPTDVVGTSADQTITPLGGIVGSMVMPGVSVPAVWSRFQDWPWLVKGTFVETGPRSRTFSYVATFSLTDMYGNVYTVVAPSAAATAVVSVPPLKVSNLEGGRIWITTGLVMLALGVVALAAFGYPAGVIAAVILGVAGMAMIIAGTLLLYDAYDPPVPDFREREPVSVDPGAWTIPEADDESLHALQTLALLVTRAVSARVRAVRYRDRAWSAYLDRDESTRIRHRDEARNELETLRRLASATTDTADEAHELVERLLSQFEDLPTLEAIRDLTRQVADELQLNDQERTIVEEQLQNTDEEDLQQSLELARSQGTLATSQLVRIIHRATADEFAERAYLE